MPKTYPAVVFVAAHGRNIAVAVGVLLTLVIVGYALVQSAGPLPVVAGIVAGVAAWAAVRLIAELVEVVSETLLPR